MIQDRQLESHIHQSYFIITFMIPRLRYQWQTSVMYIDFIIVYCDALGTEIHHIFITVHIARSLFLSYFSCSNSPFVFLQWLSVCAYQYASRLQQTLHLDHALLAEFKRSPHPLQLLVVALDGDIIFHIVVAAGQFDLDVIDSIAVGPVVQASVRCE